MSAIAKLYAQMPRQGPGTAEDVVWAVEELGLSGPVRVMDAGCGSGADLEVLAEELPDAALTGVDGLPQLVAEAQARLGARAAITQGNMAEITGPYDLIWSAGAVYFLGVTEALETWRAALASGGHIAFSEPVLPEGPRNVAEAFWAQYPAITDGEGLEARIAAAGFETMATRDVVGPGWANYYAALAPRITALRPGADAALAAVLDAAETEVATWHRAPDQILYRLSLVRPATR